MHILKSRRGRFITGSLLAATLMLGLLFQASIAQRAHAKQNGHNAHGSFYQITNLTSNIPGKAAFTDPNLKNAWGLTSSPTSPFWVSDNGAGVSTLYNGQGQPSPTPPLIVTVPAPQGSPAGTASAPTGVVFSPLASFQVTQDSKTGPSRFIFATEDGTIAGWSPAVNPTNAVQVFPPLTQAESSKNQSAVYKGLALGHNDSGDFLFATNFRRGTIDVFDSTFAPTHLSGSFSDRHLPEHYAPFGISNIGGMLYVTYAKQDAQKHDDVAGDGHGFVDVFDTNGHLVQRLIQRGNLNSPWGLAMAPSNFGRFSNALLVGNFGDGHINAYSATSGRFLGSLHKDDDHKITISGLWALSFGNDAAAGPSTTLFFTAGPNNEADGLFGSIVAIVK